MYTQDWVPHMKAAMEHGEPGDTYDVIHLNPYNPGRPAGGSTYVKTEAGWRSALYINRDIVIDPPFRI